MIATMLTLVAGAGFGEPRAERYTSIIDAVAYPIGECEGFEVWSDWLAMYSVVARVDGDGDFVQSVEHIRVLGETLYYNSTDFEKSISGGPGEVENTVWIAATGEIHVDSGMVFKVKVPGHGMIFAESGRSVIQCDPYTFQNCHLVTSAGWNDFWDPHLDALCDYLQ